MKRLVTSWLALIDYNDCLNACAIPNEIYN